MGVERVVEIDTGEDRKHEGLQERDQEFEAHQGDIHRERHGRDERPDGAQAPPPDVILLDWQLCCNESGDLLRVLRLECPSLTIITMSARPESKKCAIEAGAYAFISKNDPPEVLQVLLEVLAGKFTVSAV